MTSRSVPLLGRLFTSAPRGRVFLRYLLHELVLERSQMTFGQPSKLVGRVLVLILEEGKQLRLRTVVPWKWLTASSGWKCMLRSTTYAFISNSLLSPSTCRME